MNASGGNPVDLPELLAELRKSAELLREATRIERHKRWRSMDGGIQEALASCASATGEGRRTADEYLLATKQALQKALSTARTFTDNRRTSGTVEENDLMDQLEALVAQTEEQIRNIESVLNQKSDGDPSYHITLFGRTGTGKSTLMEILTDGNGRSIGNGSQRTTQCVRNYDWKGLRITDVPGVAAFEGAEDAETAHKAARQADLIIFLITDDAPQPAEAEHLARLRDTGRPVIGVCNVKSAMKGTAGKRLFVRDSHRTFSQERLEAIRRQFDEISAQHHPGHSLSLIYTHLLARFSANRTKDEALAEGLKEESRFWEVEDTIAAEIADKGPYLRTRSYTDTATKSALEASELMLKSSYLMGQIQRRLETRTEELEAWRTSFRTQADQKFRELINRTTGALRNRMIAFAEKHCKDDKNIGQLWNNEIQSLNIGGQMERELKQLHQEMNSHLKEVNADIGAELRHLAPVVTQYSGPTAGNPNSGNWTRWATTALGTATSVIGTVLSLIPGWQPIGLPLAFAGPAIKLALDKVLGFFNFFGLGKSEEERLREAVEKFRERALPHIQSMEHDLKAEYQKALNDMERKGILAAIAKIRAVAKSSGQAAFIARQLGKDQQAALLKLNKTAVTQALTHLNNPELSRNIELAARIPGHAITIAAYQPDSFKSRTLRQLESLLVEKVNTVRAGTSDAQILRKATGTKNVKIDRASGTATANYNRDDPVTGVKVRLASQLTGLDILDQPEGAQ